MVQSQELILIKFPEHLEDENVLFNREIISPASTEVLDNNIQEIVPNCDVFRPNLGSTSKHPPKSRGIGITTVRERSSTLDNSYNSFDFPS